MASGGGGCAHQGASCSSSSPHRTPRADETCRKKQFHQRSVRTLHEHNAVAAMLGSIQNFRVSKTTSRFLKKTLLHASLVNLMASATLIQANTWNTPLLTSRRLFFPSETKLNHATFTARSLCLGYFET